MVKCLVCESDEFLTIKNYYQMTGDKNKPTIEVSVAICSECDIQTVVSSRVV